MRLYNKHAGFIAINIFEEKVHYDYTDNYTSLPLPRIPYKYVQFRKPELQYSIEIAYQIGHNQIKCEQFLVSSFDF